MHLLLERFELHRTEDNAAGDPAVGRAFGIATSGKARVDAALLARAPQLRMISCLGAGTDGIDTDEARRRGVAIATTSKVLAGDVADVATGLILALARDFLNADRFVREGRWADGRYPLARSVRGSRVGIVGMGTVGGAVARRVEALEMVVGYHNRSPVPGSPRSYFTSIMELAAWSHFLVLCCPGGEATRHIVNAEVLEALGPDGYLINVARGSVVDDRHLVDALESQTISGAGLDVFENEPHPDPALLHCRNALLLPHIGSATQETRRAMAVAMVEALTSALRAPQP